MLPRLRDLRDAVVRALAKVGLVWVLAVLGTVLVASGLDARRVPAEAPSAAGLLLAVTLLVGGLLVLALGVLRDDDPR